MSRSKTHAARAPSPGPWPWAGVSAGLVWLLVAGSAVHWGLRLLVQGRGVPSQAQTVGLAQALQGDANRLFARSTLAAAAPAASPARDRFRVHGVAASADAGWALMSVDGRPVRAYRIGAAVDPQWVVLSVAQRRIEIGPAGGPVAVSLDLPALPPAATGRLPAAAQAVQGPAMPMQPHTAEAPPGTPPPSGNEVPPEAVAR